MNKLYEIHILISYAMIKEAFNVKTIKQCNQILDEQYGDFLDTISVRSRGMVIWDDTNYRFKRYGISITMSVRNEGDLERIKNQMWEVLEEADFYDRWIEKSRKSLHAY